MHSTSIKNKNMRLLKCRRLYVSSQIYNMEEDVDRYIYYNTLITIYIFHNLRGWVVLCLYLKFKIVSVRQNKFKGFNFNSICEANVESGSKTAAQHI